ncbi:hypothetical protein C5614_09080 [Massilia phosphatilytica]|jgi:hypothetical protein|nr:hypothetical protein C5614_09080 [Massilia phosphatilytica]
MKRLLLATLFGLACTGAHAADPSAPSRAISEATGSVVLGSLAAVSVAGSVVVVSVEKVGEGIEVVLEGAGQASRATVRLSGEAARGLSIGAGTVLQVVAMSAGQALVLSGKVIAFIPNEVGQALLHHARAS